MFEFRFILFTTAIHTSSKFSSKLNASPICINQFYSLIIFSDIKLYHIVLEDTISILKIFKFKLILTAPITKSQKVLVQLIFYDNSSAVFFVVYAI